jgi:hypothetical protein
MARDPTPSPRSFRIAAAAHTGVPPFPETPMSKKFQFIGGSRDGQMIDLGRDAFDIDFSVTLGSPEDPSKKGVYKLEGDGKFHFQLPPKSSKAAKGAKGAKLVPKVKRIPSSAY